MRRLECSLDRKGNMFIMSICRLASYPALPRMTYYSRVKNPLIRLHVICHCPAAPLLSDPDNEVVNDAWPRTLLRPKAHRVVLPALGKELKRLVPHVSANGFRPFGVQELEPQRQPVRRRRSPAHAGVREEHLPVHKGVLERQCLLTTFFGADKGMLVDTLEKGGVGGEQFCLASYVRFLLGYCVQGASRVGPGSGQ